MADDMRIVVLMPSRALIKKYHGSLNVIDSVTNNNPVAYKYAWDVVTSEPGRK